MKTCIRDGIKYISESGVFYDQEGDFLFILKKDKTPTSSDGVPTHTYTTEFVGSAHVVVEARNVIKLEGCDEETDQITEFDYLAG